MSTKIYYAWEWKSDVDSLIKFFQKFKKAYIVEVTRSCITFKNWIFKKLREDREPIFVEAYGEKIDDLELARFFRKQIQIGFNSPENISFSAVVYFQDNKIIVNFFGIESFKKLYKLVDNYPQFKYYGYWNNVDQDENATEEEWEEREVFYDKLFNKYWKPIDVGLVYEFNDIYILQNIAKRVLKKHN